MSSCHSTNSVKALMETILELIRNKETANCIPADTDELQLRQLH